MNLRSIWLVPLFLFSAGCGDTSVQADASAGDASVVSAAELGTGQLYWEPIAPAGTRVELIHGPQGGYHIFGRVRFAAPSSDVYIRFRVTPAAGGAPLNDPNDRIHLVEGRGIVRTSTGWESTSALLVVLVNIRGPSEVVGQRFRFEASIAPSPATAETPAASTSREIVIVDKT